MKSRKIVSLLLSTMLFSAAAIPAFAEEATDVTMAFCTWTGYSPMFIAKELGYFEEAGINMDIQVIEDESTYAALITRGSVQFLATAQDPNIKMFANGADSRFVLPTAGFQVQPRVGTESPFNLVQKPVPDPGICNRGRRRQLQFLSGPGNGQGAVIPVIADRVSGTVLFGPAVRNGALKAREGHIFCLRHKKSGLFLIRQGILSRLTGSPQKTGAFSAEQAGTETDRPETAYDQQDQQILYDEFTVPGQTSGRKRPLFQRQFRI